MSRKTSALAALSTAEKAIVLDELLATRPDLRERAEAYAAQLMSHGDRNVSPATWKTPRRAWTSRS